MKRWIIILGGLFIVAVLVALYVWFFVYNKPHRDYEKAKPDHILSAEQLFDSFRQDKSHADSLYTGMVLQIEGELTKIEIRDTLITAVFVFDQGMFGDEGIRCVMLPSHYKKLKQVGEGNMVSLKGYCTGYNDTDVILEKSSVVDEN